MLQSQNQHGYIVIHLKLCCYWIDRRTVKIDCAQLNSLASFDMRLYFQVLHITKSKSAWLYSYIPEAGVQQLIINFNILYYYVMYI